jgi:photosystem II stability/assembly factor-like uncharacterized protein
MHTGETQRGYDKHIYILKWMRGCRMMILKRLVAATVMMLSALILTACGPLEIQVEPRATSAPTFPTPEQIFQTPAPTLAPTVPTPLPTSQLTPTSSGPDLHLKPGTALKIAQTRMFSDTQGWGVGESDNNSVQRILFTNDGGRTWKDLTPAAVLVNPPQGGLTALAHFTAGQNAWVTFGERSPSPDGGALVVWHTRDGGASWEKSQPLDLNGVQVEFQNPSDLGFLDEQHGWMMVHLGAGMSHDYFAAFSTADGGKTWQRFLDPNTTYPLMSCYKTGLSFTSITSAWIIGNCPGLMPNLFIFNSVDSGASWSQVTLPVPDGKPANYFAQESSIACGIPGLNLSASLALSLTLTCSNVNNNTAQSWVYSSRDGGSSWSQHLLPLPYAKIGLLSLDEVFLVGTSSSDPAAAGAVYHTTNSGSTWALTTSTAWTGTPDFINSLTGWVIAQHNQVTAFVHSVDGGRTWSEIKPVIGP